MSPVGTAVYLLQFLARLLSLTLTVALGSSGLAKLIASTKVLTTPSSDSPHTRSSSRSSTSTC